MGINRIQAIALKKFPEAEYCPQCCQRLEFNFPTKDNPYFPYCSDNCLTKRVELNRNEDVFDFGIPSSIEAKYRY